MKVLVRGLDNKVYEWVDATYDKHKFLVDDVQLDETMIVSVMDDDRSEYVKCDCCGAIIKGVAAEIVAHQNKYKSCEACFDCRHLRENAIRRVETKYDLQEDGTYLAKKSIAVNLECGAVYWDRPIINSDQARDVCAFRGCTTSHMLPVSDIFIEKPGIFDDIITVDKVIEVGYKNAQNFYNSSIGYRLKGKNEVYAVVNKLNIVDYFRINYRNDTWTVFYSKKYDEFYTYGRLGAYAKWNPYRMPEATLEYIKNKIRKLYE